MSWKKIIKRTMLADNADGAKCPKCGKEAQSNHEAHIIQTTGECFDCGNKARIKSNQEWHARQNTGGGYNTGGGKW
jgi:transposase